MNRLSGWVFAVVLVVCICCAASLPANELIRGKVVDLNASKLIVRLQSGDKKTVYLTSDTKYMHRPGSGEQSSPPTPRRNDRVAVSLDGDTAIFIVVEEVPK